MDAMGWGVVGKRGGFTGDGAGLGRVVERGGKTRGDNVVGKRVSSGTFVPTVSQHGVPILSLFAELPLESCQSIRI